jgi:hypothetical protein
MMLRPRLHPVQVVHRVDLQGGKRADQLCCCCSNPSADLDWVFPHQHHHRIFLELLLLDQFLGNKLVRIAQLTEANLLELCCRRHPALCAEHSGEVGIKPDGTSVGANLAFGVNALQDSAPQGEM